MTPFGKSDPWRMINSGGSPMNSIIYIVGLVVIVLFILSFLGLR